MGFRSKSCQRVYRLLQLVWRIKTGLWRLLSPATIWRWSRDPSHEFPKPFKIGAHTTVWDASQVEDFLRKQREGA
ncbi:MAG: AlpA family phage regulatory protein [Burkholderiales bacterium]|nr:AlpA family phage regulatory protein [Burkholderiales bacterium]